MAFNVAGTGGCPIAVAHLRLYNVDSPPEAGSSARSPTPAGTSRR